MSARSARSAISARRQLIMIENEWFMGRGTSFPQNVSGGQALLARGTRSRETMGLPSTRPPPEISPEQSSFEKI